MKRCPGRRDYYDDGLLDCLDDGNALLDGPASWDEPQTAIMHESYRHPKQRPVRKYILPNSGESPE